MEYQPNPLRYKFFLLLFLVSSYLDSVTQKKIKVGQLEPSKMIPLSKAVPGISVKYGIQTLTSEIMLGKQILRLEIKVR